MSPKHKWMTKTSATRFGTHTNVIASAQAVVENPDGSDARQPTEISEVTVHAKREWRSKGTWPAHYASIIESERTPRFLKLLCDGIDEPTQPTQDAESGRKAPSRGELIFGAVMMIYAGRHAPWWLKVCIERGYLSRSWDYRTLLAALDDPTTTEILARLIEESAAPLAEFESRAGQFAIGTTVTHDSKLYRQPAPNLHLMIGAVTKVVTSAKVSRLTGCAALPDLLAATAKRFSVKEVSGDAGYFSCISLAAIDTIGAVPFIAIPRNVVGHSSKSVHAQRMRARWFSNPEDFHQRVLRGKFTVDWTLGAVMALGESGLFRSWLPVARANERLVLVLLYNLRCLCRAKRLGIDVALGPTPAAGSVSGSGAKADR